jgi:hypothetical protein
VLVYRFVLCVTVLSVSVEETMTCEFNIPMKLYKDGKECEHEVVIHVVK